MIRVLAPFLFGLLFFGAAALMAGDKTIYDFTLNSIDGQPAPLAAYKGHVVMLVMSPAAVASRHSTRRWKRSTRSTGTAAS